MLEIIKPFDVKEISSLEFTRIMPDCICSSILLSIILLSKTLLTSSFLFRVLLSEAYKAKNISTVIDLSIMIGTVSVYKDENNIKTINDTV